MSFLDAFQGYNQIRLARDDQDKTSFVTDQGIFCYNVMPFGLKNAGATYQRLVNNMFREQIGRNMEVYIDDMMVKSQKKENHKQDLQECFGILQHFGMKLNPKKCTFGVRGGKFSGFMISQRGIEVNPEKIKAILEMKPPRTIQEVQRLTGRLAALNRFISRSSDRGLPFFKPKDEETLYIYLATSQGAISAVLTREEGRDHQPVYYVSKTLQGVEEKYPPIEKLAFALVAVELSEYGIEYHPRPAIKAQALVDFVVEMTAEEGEHKQRWWKLFVDGSSTLQGSGVGVILETPQGDKIQYALRFSFDASNNEAEYEALLAGGRLAQAAGAKYLRAYSDSQLVVNQVNGEYEAKVWRRSDVQGNIGKLDAKWEGPYRVIETIGNATYKLEKPDGKEIPRTWNASNLKKFYA
ncbi:Retrovirus-related Pol polyprotein from transposon opus [Sesamum angolense]|uniref:Retrovirus-related Pol polyprotein from transposon opus n=1 Tax=Sesamum angolense TaxID=2727404 RepID=A0AAE1WGH7_9LAMI|nr:Retrovirus-related Pol polyprotein from transposon opus [Sesamum angolense]